MISNETLQAMIKNAAEIGGEEMSDLHTALIELHYRRQKMPKLERKAKKAKNDVVQIKRAVQSNPRSSPIRARMARLKFW